MILCALNRLHFFFHILPASNSIRKKRYSHSYRYFRLGGFKSFLFDQFFCLNENHQPLSYRHNIGTLAILPLFCPHIYSARVNQYFQSIMYLSGKLWNSCLLLYLHFSFDMNFFKRKAIKQLRINDPSLRKHHSSRCCLHCSDDAPLVSVDL